MNRINKFNKKDSLRGLYAHGAVFLPKTAEMQCGFCIFAVSLTFEAQPLPAPAGV